MVGQKHRPSATSLVGQTLPTAKINACADERACGRREGSGPPSLVPRPLPCSARKRLLSWRAGSGHETRPTRLPLTRQKKILSSAPHRCRPFYTAVLPTFPGHYIIYIIYMPTAPTHSHHEALDKHSMGGKPGLAI